MAPSKSNGKHTLISVIKQKKKSSAASIVGAPAQHNQSSRKGKKAWRKNVDIEDLEEKLEGLREEERTFGYVFFYPPIFHSSSNVSCRQPLQKKTDSDLFTVDTKGDDKGTRSLTSAYHEMSHVFSFLFSVRKSLPRFSRTALRSHQIISQRSAVPAVHARPRKSLVSSREKERLLRIARKDRRGPLNSIVDPSEPGAGSALLEVTEAVKESGKYDMWSAEADAGLDDGVKVKVCMRAAPRPGLEMSCMLMIIRFM